MEYSSEVRRRFSAPARAGEIRPSTPACVEGDAEDRSLSVWVRFQVRSGDAGIERVRFRAFGCPHTIAAADRIAEWLEGRSWQDLDRLDLARLAQELELPREKFGKLLCLDDALRACRKQAERKARG